MSKIIKKIYHVLTLDLLFPLQYARNSRKPIINNKAVFIELNLPSLSGSLKYLYDEMDRQGTYHLSIHCLKETFSGKAAFIRHALNCLKDMADAKYIFLCEGSRLVSCIKPRPETFITQLWHGCGAFKRFGFSTSDLRFGGTRAENTRYSYYRNYNLVTVSSPEVIWAYQEAMNLPADSDVVRPIGVSRTDIYFQDTFKTAARTRITTLIPSAATKKILLYAPTFRQTVGNAQPPTHLDLKKMQSSLQKDYILLIKHHPLIKTRPAIPPEAETFAYDVSETCTIEDLICISDICISDYSSLVFEYSLTERPILFYAYDLDDYEDWRGFYYDYNTLTPGPILRTTPELIEAIQALEQGFDRTAIQAFRTKFMTSCDGQATSRLLKSLPR